jgi:hypothetical protein
MPYLQSTDDGTLAKSQKKEKEAALCLKYTDAEWPRSAFACLWAPFLYHLGRIFESHIGGASSSTFIFHCGARMHCRLRCKLVGLAHRHQPFPPRQVYRQRVVTMIVDPEI